MGVTTMYAASIRKAVASNDINQMKAVLEQAKKQVREQKDLAVALVELQEAIDRMK
ncbi:MAG: DUF1843 domain-containing protein [Crocinitomicaceae bacterium]|nr:DUF1843 domain-containing protein [Crocinitomicaceae bacterium]